MRGVVRPRPYGMASSAGGQTPRAVPGSYRARRAEFTGPSADLTGRGRRRGRRRQRLCGWGRCGRGRYRRGRGPGRSAGLRARPSRRRRTAPRTARVGGGRPGLRVRGARRGPGVGRPVPAPVGGPVAGGRRTRRRGGRDIRCTCTLRSTPRVPGSVDACLKCRQIRDYCASYRGECCGGKRFAWGVSVTRCPGRRTERSGSFLPLTSRTDCGNNEPRNQGRSPTPSVRSHAPTCVFTPADGPLRAGPPLREPFGAFIHQCLL